MREWEEDEVLALPDENSETAHELTLGDSRVEGEEVGKESSDREEFVGRVTGKRKQRRKSDVLGQTDSRLELGLTTRSTKGKQCRSRI